MIAASATLTIQRIPIACLLITEVKARYASMVLLYVRQLHENPHDDPGLLRVRPSQEHRGLYEVEDGHHRYVALLIVGRVDALCVVIEGDSNG